MTTRSVPPLVAAVAAVCLLAPAAAAGMPALSLAIPDFAPAGGASFTAPRVAPVSGPARQGDLDLDQLAPPTAGWTIVTDDNARARLEVIVVARQPAPTHIRAAGDGERLSAL